VVGDLRLAMGIVLRRRDQCGLNCRAKVGQILEPRDAVAERRDQVLCGVGTSVVARR
jgi:hypothetical protein